MEKWRTISGYAGYYEVSSWGRVRSLARMVRGRDGSMVPRPAVMLKLGIDPRGYSVVFLSFQSKKQTCRVHQLVARAFIGPAPIGHEVCHEDDDQRNNKLANLVYKPHGENMRDSHRRGRGAIGTRNGAAKLTPEAVREIRALRRQTWTLYAIADLFGVTHQSIAQVLDGRTWRHVKD